MLQSHFTLTQTSVAALSILVFSLGWRALGSIVHRHFLRRMTILLDLPNIGQPRPDSQRIKGAAVICGGRFVRCQTMIVVHIDRTHTPQRSWPLGSSDLRGPFRGGHHSRARGVVGY